MEKVERRQGMERVRRGFEVAWVEFERHDFRLGVVNGKCGLVRGEFFRETEIDGLRITHDGSLRESKESRARYTTTVHDHGLIRPGR